MSPMLFWRLLWRELRGARSHVAFFIACVAVGVAAVVGVAALTEAVELGIRARSRELLGGDLAVEARRPLPDVSALLPPEYTARAEHVALQILPSMIRGPSGASRLVEIKAVDLREGHFPLAGELGLTPARRLEELLADDHSLLLAPAIMEAWKLRLGDQVFVGGEAFYVRGVVEKEPEPLTFSFSFGPRVLMTSSGLARTKLLGFGNRVRYRSLFSFPAGTSDQELARVKRWLSVRIPGGTTFVSIETHAEAQPALRKTIERVERYLGLVALLSLLVGSVGVAQIVSAWIAQAAPQTAILRCLGFSPREVLALYLAHTVLLALVGSGVGGALGMLLPLSVARVYPELLPTGAAFQLPWLALLRGVSLGVGVALLFSLAPLTAVWKVSPARVLRAEAEPLAVPRLIRFASFGAAAASIFGAAWAQSRQGYPALAFSAGVLSCAALLWLAARALLWVVAALPRARLPALLWQGAAALTRPSAGTIGSIVALGLGTMVVATITLVQDQLAQGIGTALPEHAPSVFLTDVQPDQWRELEQLCRAASATHIEGVPVVMGRLAAIDGRSVEQLLRERPGDRNERERTHWLLTREQRISFRRTLPASNQLVAGSLWSEPRVTEMSLESDFARDLGARLGSTLRFDIQGVPMDFKVSSLRSVDWRSFAANFFLLAEPGSLDDAPQIRLGALRMPADREQALQDELSARFPNITMLRVRPMLARLASLLDQAALAVRVLGSFAALTGLIMLLGAIASTQLRRAREVALLKTLGVQRAQIVALLALEYALSGAVAGVLGALSAYALAFAFTHQMLQLSTAPSVLTCALTVAATSLLSVVGGLLASAHALKVPPLEVLRN